MTSSIINRGGPLRPTLPLSLATSISELEAQVKSDVICKIEKADRALSSATTLYKEIHATNEDQERAYILGKRYLAVMDKLWELTDDQNYVRVRYGGEWNQIKVLVRELRIVLTARYDELRLREKNEEKNAKEESNRKLKESKTETDASNSEKTYPIFPNKHIDVAELYEAIIRKEDMLLVDIRASPDFKASNIIFSKCINIPEDIILPGLTPNTIKPLLESPYMPLWEKRDSFGVIVLMDWNTDIENFPSSKLDRLRSFITEWDFNRKYKQAPVFVNGGFLRFLETYPSMVVNFHVFLKYKNESIDELLQLDTIKYPEPDPDKKVTFKLKSRVIENLPEDLYDIDTSEIDTDSTITGTNSDSGSVRSDEAEFSGRSDDSGNSEESEQSNKSGGTVRELHASPAEPNLRDPSLLFHEEPEFVNMSEAQTPRTLLKPPLPNVTDIISYSERKKSPLVLPTKLQEVEDELSWDFPEEKGDTNVPQKKISDLTPYIIPPEIRRDTKPGALDISAAPPVPPKPIALGGGWCGLTNIKNTCYQNTILQCLKLIPVIRFLFVQLNYKKFLAHKASKPPKPPKLIDVFSLALRALWQGDENNKRVFCPLHFYNRVCQLNPIYGQGNHEDCMEFFLFLINVLSSDCIRDITRPSVMTEREKSWYSNLQGQTSVFVELFYHQFANKKVCTFKNCGNTIVSYENDNTIMLPVPRGEPNLHLTGLLNKYMKETELNDYVCNKCRNRKIELRKEVEMAPTILVLVLKRYYHEGGNVYKKIEDKIGFDLTLKFGPHIYKLISIAEHKGSMSFGHYLCHGIIKSSKTSDDEDIWAEFNDENVSRYKGLSIVNDDDVKSAACAFFYYKLPKKSGNL